MWFRTAIFCFVALGAVAVAFGLGPYVPAEIADKFGGEATDQILSLLSSSMLVITTFSLGTMVSAHNSASSSATPRAAPLLVEDNYAQNALSTFVGVFVYSVIALVAMDAGVYSDGERTVLFGVTAGVLVVVVITLIRWIDELTQLGQMHDTLTMIELATIDAMRSQLESPGSCANRFESIPEGFDVLAGEVGYIQTIDFKSIDRTLGESDARLYLQCQPGTFTHRNKVICRVTGIGQEQAEAIEASLRKAFVIGPRRTMLQDPRYGLLILSEVAARALSPGVNDPDSAIDAVVVSVRILDEWDRHWVKTQQSQAELTRRKYSWLYSNPIEMDEMLSACFDSVIRYGSAQYPVMSRLLRALHAVGELNPEYQPAVRAMVRRVMARAQRDLEDEREQLLLREDHSTLFGPGGS